MKKVFFLVVLLFILIPKASATDLECEIENSYSISYVTNGGSISSNKIVISMENELAVLKQPVPTKSGYEFKGWYYDSDYNELATFNNIKELNKDYFIKLSSTECEEYYELKLYAKWELSCPKVKYTHHIVFDNKYATLSKIGVSSDGSQSINLPTINRDGYDFLGWYYDSDFKNKANINKASDIIDKYYKKISSTECNDYYEIKLYPLFKEQVKEGVVVKEESKKENQKEEIVALDDLKVEDKDNKYGIISILLIGMLMVGLLAKYKLKRIK